MSRLTPAAAAQEKSVSIPFFLTIVLIVIVGFMLANATYWKNLQDEHDYRVKRFQEQQKQLAQDTD
jgi:hypothetical protein